MGDAHNGVDIRRARLECEGEGFDIYFYRFDVDFVTFDSSTQTRLIIFDSYLDTQALPYLGNLQAGHFREPFSLERLDSSHDLPFLERSSPVNALTPNRNIGLMAFHWNEAETATIAYGLFDENTNEYGEDNRDQTGLAGTCRATWLPWYDEASGRGLFHVGASYSYQHLGGNHLRRFAITPEVQLKEGLTSRTPNFVETSWGAWEATARLSTLNLNSGNIQGGQTDVTLGMNFYYAVRSRVMFNYIHSFLDRNNVNGNADVVAMRFQFAF